MTVLHAGEIGRLNSTSSINDTDDLTFLRSGQLLRVTAEVLAAYIVAENTTVREVTFADTPVTILSTDDRIYADTTNGNIVVNLISLSIAPLKPIHVQKTDVSVNTVTITADGSDTINGVGTKVISSQDVDHELVPASEWRLS